VAKCSTKVGGDLVWSSSPQTSGKEGPGGVDDVGERSRSEACCRGELRASRARGGSDKQGRRVRGGGHKQGRRVHGGGDEQRRRAPLESVAGRGEHGRVGAEHCG
jgi:hypothetical protein